jgi:uroporphyrinogen III methyltransferase/synthase
LAIRQIASYDWVMFTSVNTVEPFLSRLQHAGKSVAKLKQLKIAAIGSETAKRLEAMGIVADVIPARYQAEGILESLSAAQMAGKRVLIPRAAKARDLLPDTLRQWGASVDVVEAYRTVAPPGDIGAIKGRWQRGAADVITFTSSSTVSNFVQLFEGKKLSAIVGDTAIACIGPITAGTVEEFGGRAAIIAQEFTIDGLVKALVDYFSPKKIATDSF